MITGARAVWKRIWQKIAEPRIQRVTFMVIYLFHAVAGLGVLVAEPTIVMDVLGIWPTVVWGTLLMLGGGVGAVAVIPGWNYIERIAIIAVLVGLGMVSIIILATTSGGSAISLWALVTAWLVVFIYRAWEIRLYTVAPTT